MTLRNTAALLHHVMRKKPHIKNVIQPVFGYRNDLTSSPDRGGNIQMTETRIYVGLNDAETREQKYENETYVDILKDVCRSHHIAFSLDIEEGGYYHEDGEYTEETSLVLILVEADPDTVQAIAKDLCARFHQESVLITEDRVSGRFIGLDDKQPSSSTTSCSAR